MRRAGNLDRNHKPLVLAAMGLGMSVEPKLSRLGDGVPDVLLGKYGLTFPAEFKDFPAGTVKGDLNPEQSDWWRLWRGWSGDPLILRSIEDVQALDERMRRWAGILERGGGGRCHGIVTR